MLNHARLLLRFESPSKLVARRAGATEWCGAALGRALSDDWAPARCDCSSYASGRLGRSWPQRWCSLAVSSRLPAAAWTQAASWMSLPPCLLCLLLPTISQAFVCPRAPREFPTRNHRPGVRRTPRRQMAPSRSTQPFAPCAAELVALQGRGVWVAGWAPAPRCR